MSMVTRGVLTGVSCLCLSLAVACSNPEKAKRRHLAKADAYLSQGKNNEAIVEYRNALKADPKFGEARYKLAETYVGAGKHQQAFKEYMRAADLMPDNIDVQLKAGAVLLMARQFEDAKTRAQAVLKKDPRNVNGQILLGNALAGLKDLDGALAEMQDAVEIDPASDRPYMHLGAIQLARGNKGEAETAFKKAVEISADSVTARLALANFYWSTARQAEAEPLLVKAAELAPADARANRALVLFYLAAGRMPQAEKPLKALAAGPQWEPRLWLANYYIVTNRRKEAANILSALERRPEAFAAAKTRLALLAYVEGRRDQAHQMLDEVLRKDPKFEHALLVKARWLFQENNADRALSTLKTAIAANPRSIGAHYLQGVVLSAKREPAQAIAAFNEVLKLNPRATAAQLQLSTLHLAGGRADESVQLAQDALKADPSNRDARITLVRGLLARRDTAGAEAELTKLLKDHPKAALVHVLDGALKGAKADQRGARRAFERALELAPKNAEALQGLVGLDVATNRHAEARVRVESRLAENPRDPELLFLAARTYAAGRDYERAEQSLRKLIDVAPSHIGAYTLLGRLYFATGKVDAALKEYEELTRRQPQSVQGHMAMGFIQQFQNNIPQATARYQKVLEIDPRNPVAANNLAWIHAERGADLDIALELAQKAKAQLPDHAEVSDTLGWVFYKKGLSRLAVAPLQQSVEKDPRNPTYHYHLGLAYAGAGDADKARRALEEALKLNPAFPGSDDARRALASLPPRKS